MPPRYSVFKHLQYSGGKFKKKDPIDIYSEGGVHRSAVIRSNINEASRLEKRQIKCGWPNGDWISAASAVRWRSKTNHS